MQIIYGVWIIWAGKIVLTDYHIDNISITDKMALTNSLGLCILKLQQINFHSYYFALFFFSLGLSLVKWKTSQISLVYFS